MQSLGWARMIHDIAIREDSSLAVLRGRTLHVMWTKWPYPATWRGDAKVFFLCFFSLCTILKVYVYYIVYFQPNCNDVLKDFTMGWEINTFISVQHLSCVLCLVNSCSLTISEKKKQTIIRKVESNKCLRLSTAVCKWSKLNPTVWTMCVSYGTKTGFC